MNPTLTAAHPKLLIAWSSLNLLSTTFHDNHTESQMPLLRKTTSLKMPIHMGPQSREWLSSARCRPGFTLVELIVASVIAAILAGAASVSLARMIRARTSSEARQTAYARAEGVTSRIALDLLNVMRDSNLANCRVQIRNGGLPNAERDDLLLLTRSLRPVRADSIEGDEYEAHYRIAPMDATNVSSPSDAFWKRTDPAHDDYQDGGGVATAIAQGAVALSIQATDGESWFEDWNSDSDGLPHAVRVVAVARSDDGKAQIVSRRIIALDRVPIPPEETTDSETESETTPSTSTPRTTTPSTGTSSGGGRSITTPTTTPRPTTPSTGGGGGDRGGGGGGAPRGGTP